MTKQQNVRVIQRFFEEQVNRDDTSLYEEFISKNVVIHGPGSDQKVQGLLKAKKIDASYIRSYPLKKFEIEEIFPQGDRVIVRWICRGNYKGKYKGIQPKRPDFAISGLSIYRLSKGKIIEIWQYWDRLGLLEQIGEILTRKDAVEPGYYHDLLKNFGMEKYLEANSFLTERERQCLKCLLEGKTAKETAAFYKLSTRTVESYFENIKKKLKCPTKRDLFATAQILEKLDLL